MSDKREDYISWDEYFMGVAILSAQRSKDPNTQVGACIVSQDNKILSMGYNGFPKGCSDDAFPWCRGPSVHRPPHSVDFHFGSAHMPPDAFPYPGALGVHG